MLWCDYVDLYLDGIAARRPSAVYLANVTAVLRRFSAYCNLADRRLADITQLDLAAYVRRRSQDTYRGRPLAAVTINNEIRCINSCLAKAGPRGTHGASRHNYALLDCVPPCAELLREQRRLPRTVQASQLEAFLRAAQSARLPILPGLSPVHFWRAAIALALVTALRRAALLQIPRPDQRVLVHRRVLVLPAGLNKTDCDIEIALGSQRLVQLLAVLPSRPGEPLLPWRRPDGRPMSLTHFSRTIRSIQQSAGIPSVDWFRLKDLRSTAGTATALRVSEIAAQRKLGHSPGTNTLRKHYLSGRVHQADHDASAQLADVYLPVLLAAAT